MGKLMNHLQIQLKTDKKQDAEECIKVYNDLLKNTGHVWSSQWQQLAEPTFKGFPSDERTYSLTHIGKTYLKGLENVNKEQKV